MGFGIPYFVLSPTTLLNLVGLLVGPDKTTPTPKESWENATLEVLIPVYNEESNIVLCLASLMTQTLKPRRVHVIDDGSKDSSYAYAKEFSKNLGIEVTLIRREKSEGKTVSVKEIARNSDCDLLCILDSDTVLRSENYLESLVRGIYQGIGIASASGMVVPFMNNDRERVIQQIGKEKVEKQYPAVLRKSDNWLDNLQYNITNFYREQLYIFLQKFVYHAQMVFFGTIINPIGCAVIYRRIYLKDMFDYYQEDLGDNLTTSEDIFIGFSFINAGYRNIHVKQVYALTQEPKVLRLPSQIFKWSSSFYQCCYYFNDLVASPFKLHKVIYKELRDWITGQKKKIKEMRKVKEAYRYAFGAEVTEKYGRPIGWYVFFAAVEKCSFPMVLFFMMYLQLWFFLAITLSIEIILYTLVVFFFHKNRKIRNLIKCIVTTPIRYSILVLDLVVMACFVKDIYFSEDRAWKK